MRRAYADIDDSGGFRQIHYRECGAGSPLVMLHPSPLSSQSLAPQIAALSAEFRCIAWDTPGYGFSDALPDSAKDDRTLAPYVEALAGFLDSLSLDAPLIYGSATGAQIAVEFARTYPARCSGLLLENAALFEEAETSRILDGYFPDIDARDDGSHLALLWTMAARSTRFFPWYADGPEAERRPAYAPASIVNGVVRDYLLSGPDYDRAYRAAFANERPERLQALAVNTHVLLWEDGLLGEYGERVGTVALPDCVAIRKAGAGMEARLATLLDSAVELRTLIENPTETTA